MPTRPRLAEEDGGQLSHDDYQLPQEDGQPQQVDGQNPRDMAEEMMTDTSLNEEELFREEDNHLTCLHPWWKFDSMQCTFGCFMNHKVEFAYRKWHHKMWLPRARWMFVLSTLIFNIGFVLQSFYVSPGSMKGILMKIHEDSRTQMYVVSMSARAVPLVYGMFLTFPSGRQFVTPERYQWFVTSAILAAFIVEQTQPCMGFYPYFAVPNRTDSNADAWADVDAWAAEPKIVSRQTFWHAMVSDAWYILIGALSGLRPHIALVLGVMMTVSFQLQFQNTYVSLDMLRVGRYGHHSGTGPFQVMWAFRVLPLSMMVFMSYVLEGAQRAEFRVRLMLMVQKDLRIEQLKQEKEHLDWDRKMVQKLVEEARCSSGARQQSPHLPCPLPHSMSGSTAASCAEVEAIAKSIRAAARPSAPSLDLSLSSVDVSVSEELAGLPGAVTHPLRSVAEIEMSGVIQPLRSAADLNWPETRQLTRLERPPSESTGSLRCELTACIQPFHTVAVNPLLPIATLLTSPVLSTCLPLITHICRPLRLLITHIYRPLLPPPATSPLLSSAQTEGQSLGPVMCSEREDVLTRTLNASSLLVEQEGVLPRTRCVMGLLSGRQKRAFPPA